MVAVLPSAICSKLLVWLACRICPLVAIALYLGDQGLCIVFAACCTLAASADELACDSCYLHGIFHYTGLPRVSLQRPLVLSKVLQCWWSCWMAEVA